jgi:hypothetical protein
MADLESQRSRRLRAGGLALLFVLPFVVYAANLDDYFLGDDFDLIVSIDEQGLAYHLRLLYSNESGRVWSDSGIDAVIGRGYLRPVKIWLLGLDLAAWGPSSLGFHLTTTAVFAGFVVGIFLLLEAMLPGQRSFAWLGAGLTAVHPVFGEIVPFITAREETLAALFSVFAIVAHVRARQTGRTPWGFVPLYALAIFTKESALPVLLIPVAYDALYGHLDASALRRPHAVLPSYVGILLLLGAYFALRLIAFGNVEGGDIGSRTFISPGAFARFHAALLASLSHRSLFGAPSVLAGAIPLLAAVATLWVCTSRERRGRWLRPLLFLGPVLYLGATAILHGTYFSGRHHGFAVAALLAFVACLLAAVSERFSPRTQAGLACAVFVLGCGVFVPATLVRSGHFDAASRVVDAIRSEIEARTASLPNGCLVAVRGVPQHTEPPWFFGWGLRSALQRPFTPSDLSRRCTVVNRRNLELTGLRIEMPERVDLDLDFGKDEGG